MVVKPVRAFESEIVEIRWQCRDGSFFYQRVGMPPPEVREFHVIKPADDRVETAPVQEESPR